MGDITQLLGEMRNGSRDAASAVMTRVYDELHQLAAAYMRRERSDHTLQTTALVHEAYLRLIGQRDVEWQSRAHFFGVAAQMMRRILTDHADHPSAVDDLALVTNLFYRCSDFHCLFLSICSGTRCGRA